MQLLVAFRLLSWCLSTSIATITASVHPQDVVLQNAILRRPKLDVGFTDFENKFSTEVERVTLDAIGGCNWSDIECRKLKGNIASFLNTTFAEMLKPLKQDISETWVIIEQNGQKDKFITQLRAGFLTVFNSTLQFLETRLSPHIQKMVQLKTQSLDQTTVFENVFEMVRAGLADKYCYNIGGTATKAGKRKFCSTSILENLAKRLKDQEMLVAMTCRFEAHTSSMAEAK